LEELARSRIGQTLAGRFQLQRLIAIGGMAAVYEAIQSPLMRRVAVKVLHPREIEAGRRDYFLREANAVAQLRHPNIVAIVDFGQEPDGTLFLAMELIPGVTLRALLSLEYPLDHGRLLHIAEQVCLGLEVAHRAGVVHCDMKPSNIMIEPVRGNPDHVKVLDFGIARTQKKGPWSSHLDREIIGSQYYMAPEQVQGVSVSPQTDVYGLGVVIFTALTASYPFSDRDDARLVDAIVNRIAPVPSAVRPELSIPVALDAIVARALAKDPADRYESCDDFRRALMAIDGNERSRGVALESLGLLDPEEEMFQVGVDVLGSSSSGMPAKERRRLEGFGPLPTVAAPPPIPTRDAAEDDAPVEPGRGRPPLVGRRHHLDELRRVAALTRRGCVCVQITGGHGMGASFLATRALEELHMELGATILYEDLGPEACDYPLRSVGHLVSAALSECAGLTGGVSAPGGETVWELRRRTLLELGLGRFETASLQELLDSQATDLSHPAVLEGPLRLAATRIPLLTHALGELLRNLVLLVRRHGPNGAPVVVVVDGWAYCDAVSRAVLRGVLARYRSLPVLFVAVTTSRHLSSSYDPKAATDPRSTPADDGRDWDLKIHVAPYTLDETREFVRWCLGRSVPSGVLHRLAVASSGSPLALKDLADVLLADAEASGGEWSWSKGLIPLSSDGLFTQQIDGLSRDARMLLAVCTVVGPTFHESLLWSVMPKDFDVGGALAELISCRVIETGTNSRLRFRFPQMREISHARLRPRLRRSLHRRVADLPAAQATPISSWFEDGHRFARHLFMGGDPEAGIRALVESAIVARESGEPHLSLRRCQQAEGWIRACRKEQANEPYWVEDHRFAHEEPLILDPEVVARVGDDALEVLRVRATVERIVSVRVLGLEVGAGPECAMSDRYLEGFLRGLEGNELVPPFLCGRASLAVGRLYADLGRHTDSQRPLQLGVGFADAAGDVELLIALKLALVRTLRKAGRYSKATELAGDVVRHLRADEVRRDDDFVSLSRALEEQAKICVELKEYPRAEHYLDQAMAAARADRDAPQIVAIELDCAALYRAQRQSERALEALERALAVGVATRDLRVRARTLLNLGVTCGELGDRDQARKHLADASEIAINLGWATLVERVNGQLERL
jgi:serine/threonine protein kinase/tetratricopeptide (TPR) repeat protein